MAIFHSKLMQTVKRPELGNPNNPTKSRAVSLGQPEYLPGTGTGSSMVNHASCEKECFYGFFGDIDSGGFKDGAIIFHNIWEKILPH